MVKKTREASLVRLERENQKNAILKSTQRTIEALLTSPDGLTKKEMLLISDSENLLSLSQRVRNYLKKNSNHTLKKKTINKETIYYLG